MSIFLFLLYMQAPPPPTAAPTLPAVRTALESAARGDVKPAAALRLDVTALNWWQELRLGHLGCDERPPFIAIVVAGLHHGTVLLFDAGGALLGRRTIGEPVDIQLRDLDDDGLSEIVLEEVDGWGTGLYETSYHVYGFQKDAIHSLWHAPALWSWAGLTPESGRAFLKVEWRWAKPPLLLYIADGIRDGAPVRKREAWELQNGRLIKVPFPKHPGV